MPVNQLSLENRTGLGNSREIRTFLKGGKIEESHPIDQLSDAELEKKLNQISQVKRFYERWEADPNFKQEFLTNPHQAVRRYNINIDAEEISLLHADAIAQKDPTDTDYTPISIKRYQEFYRGVQCDMSDIAGSSTDARFQAWRERQMARCSSQMYKSISDGIVHMTACFELSKGCSVGCWFCSVSAPRLGDIFTYNHENAKLWREVLALLKHIHGPAAQAGFCYWATDPLDNPDYEKFCSDFYDLLGNFPQTTTAQALRDPARTRSLLKFSQSKGGIFNRFSILSLKMLDQLYQEFSPEELTFVRLVLQNPETGIIKANSGRARERNQRKAEKNNEVLDDSFGTNACVSGFLFNMVERSVKLISPCNADERWTDGYRIYDEGTFTTVDDLKILLEGMIEKHMPLTVRPNDRLSFRRDLHYESLPDGFQVSTKFKTHKFRNDPYLKQLGEAIHKGDKTATEIASLFNICGIPSVYIFQSLNLMFKEGVLDDEPK